MKTVARLLCAALLLAWNAAPTRAEDGAAQAEWKGTIRGQVVDSQRGSPVGYATVTLIWPAPADGSEPRREEQVSDPNGGFEFAEVPAGIYTLSFSKTGYQTSTLVDFSVTPEQLDRADFKLPPLETPGDEAAPKTRAERLEEIPDAEEFVVLGARVEALEASRAESDQMLNTLSAEEFAKFAASDVADALKFVAGVNVVEGQFAIIRGLEDRYSSTLYNSAPIPSPDPDRQSVQLDLFASDIVDNLAVAKTFGPELPSNSSAGSINILTHAYPDDIEAKLQVGSGFNEEATNRFLAFNRGSPVGTEEDGLDTIESDFAGSVGGRTKLFGHELRFKGVAAREVDYETAKGFQEALEPRRPEFLIPSDEGTPFEEITRSGSLPFGELQLTKGHYDLTQSEKTKQLTGYGGLGIDLDEAGNHRLDGSIFYTKKQNDAVELKENGYLAGFDYGPAAEQQAMSGQIDPGSVFQAGQGSTCLVVCATLDSFIGSPRPGEPNSGANKGPLWYASFSPSRSFEFDRDLIVYQLNGDHRIPALDGLHVSWAANRAKTTQTETALAANIFYEPSNDGTPGFVIPTQFPVTVQSLRAADEAAGGLPEGYAPYTTIDGIVNSSNDVRENAWFGRLDGDYELQIAKPLRLRLTSGGWYEHAGRDVESNFLENPLVNHSSNFGITGASMEALGETLFSTIDGGFNRLSTNESKREIKAANAGLKATLWDRLDLLGGLRVEDIFIESLNDPFTGAITAYGGPQTFPDSYIFFDRLDNPNRGEVNVYSPTATYNDQLLGIDVPLAPCQAFDGSIPNPAQLCVDLADRSITESLINGTIDELKLLPAAGVTWRPLDGMAVRGAWSRTVARPSFREMGFYASVELGTDDLVVGNPQLTLSEVESWDGRVEYMWGEQGDLAAFSAFYKTIDQPIESIVVRNPITLEGNALWRTFFNNPNTAKLYGIELEMRKNLGFFGPEALEYFSLGGNFTYIHARVDRTDAELKRSQIFFQTTPGSTPSYTGLETSRRLFGQPEWIVNTDLSFDQPDWGTRLTLSFFAISDLLDAAGTAAAGPDGRILSFTLDRYIDWYYTLDLIFSQTFPFDVPLEPLGMEGTIPSALTFKTSIKNLTDSTRRIIYDPAQTSQTRAERSYKVGRDYSISLTYTFAF